MKFKKPIKYSYGPNIVYNRAKLMRKQLMGVLNELTEEDLNGTKEIEQKNQPMPILNAYMSENQIMVETQVKKAQEDNKDEKKQEEILKKINPEIKVIKIRHRYNWLVMKFENCMEFYEFLDEFKLFGLLEENGKGLIINNYDDLIYNNDQALFYRVVSFDQFDLWVPPYVEEKKYSQF